MLVAFTHDKGAKREFFLEVLDKAMNGVKLNAVLRAKAHAYKAIPGDDPNRAAQEAAIQGTMSEIKHVRLALLEQFELVRQCRPKAALNS